MVDRSFCFSMFTRGYPLKTKPRIQTVAKKHDRDWRHSRLHSIYIYLQYIGVNAHVGMWDHLDLKIGISLDPLVLRHLIIKITSDDLPNQFPGMT